MVRPFRSIDNLEFISKVINRDPNFTIKILTSYSRINEIDLAGADDIPEAVSDYWHNNITTESSPAIEIIFVGVKSLNLTMPIHDRWWITKKEGLRFGTSIGSLGKKRLSEISILLPEDVINVERKVGGFLSGSQKLYEGERIRSLRLIVD